MGPFGGLKMRKIYVPKAICVLSRYNFNDYYSEIIEDLYISTKTCLLNPLEHYILKLMVEVKYF